MAAACSSASASSPAISGSSSSSSAARLATRSSRSSATVRTLVPPYARKTMQTAGDVGAVTGQDKAAQSWIEAVQLGRYDTAWAMTEPRLRLVRAQAWIWNNRKDADIAACNRDELARALAEERPDHPLWGDFAATELHQITGVYAQFRPENWGASSSPSAAGPDYALVLSAHMSGAPPTITARP